MAITLTQLRSFLALVREGSTGGAADALVVTQPSVSAAVSALSEELGVKLTERVGRGVRPSAAGSAFAPYAAHVIGLLDEGRRVAREVAESTQSELRIAAVTTAAEFLVPPLMQAFAARHQEIALTVDVGNRDWVFQQVRDHRADIAIGGRPPGTDDLVGAAFVENEIVLIARADEPHAGGAPVSVSALADAVWLLREKGSGTRSLTEQFLAEQGLHPRLMTLGSNGAIKQAVRAGLGISLQSRMAVALELEAGRLAVIPTHEPLPRRQWFVSRSTVGPNRPSVSEFVAFVCGDEAAQALGRSLAA
jgi:DNA-binding transcriptional LysR family regulator